MIVSCTEDSRSEHEQRNYEFDIDQRLDVKKVCARMVPENLNGEQRMRRKKFPVTFSGKVLKEPNILVKIE
jgi:hypothetical protein